MKIFGWRVLSSQQGIIPLVVMVAVGLVSASGVTVAASQKSIPGDALYGVKQATENVRVAVAISKQDKAKVHLDIAEEKVKEIEKLEEKGKTEKIVEAAQNLEESQDQALELTETIQSEGENVDELVELLEVQSNKQQVVITRVSPKLSVQVSESLLKSLEQFREQLKVTIEVESDEEEEQEEEDSGQQQTQQTPCPSPSPSEDETEEASDQEEESADEEDWWGKWNDYGDDYWETEDQDVQGVSQLRNSQGSSFGRDPCDSAEGSAGAGSQTFNGGAGTSDSMEGSSDGVGDQGGETVGEPTAPTSTNPDVEGVSTTGGLLQLILNVLFQPQKW